MIPRKASAALAIATAAAMIPVAAPSALAMPRPAAPTKVHQVGATRTSFTVQSAKASHAHKYVLIASRVKSDVFFKNLGKSRHRRIEVATDHPTMTARKLHKTTRPYYYRVQSRNGHRTSLSGIHKGHVAPSKPTGVRAIRPTPGKHGLAVTWANQSADGFTVAQALNKSMSKSKRTYRIAGNSTQFTPYGLHSGTRYYFRVRADNGAAHSGYSKTVTGTFSGHESTMSMLTWNVLHAKFDGTKENGNTIAPWSKRLKVVTAMLRKANPDLININEANDFLGNHQKRHRQIDTIAANFKKQYGLADADFTNGTYHPQIGNYVLYRKSMFRPLFTHQHGKAHYWAIASKQFVTYQAFENTNDGARFLLVSTHLTNGPDTKKYDGLRKKETRKLLGHVAQLQKSDKNYRDLPVIYAGDFNSFEGPNPANVDSPGDYLRAHHVTDALMAAQSRTNTKYGSVNGYTRTPSHTGRIIDHFYATAGVAFRTWKQVMNLKHGKWPGTIPSDHNPIMVSASVQH